MEFIYFFGLVMTLFLTTFYSSFNYGKVNRGFLLLSSAIFENSIVVYTTDDYEEYIPYYNCEFLESSVNEYLAETVFPYLENEIVEYFYYDYKSGIEIFNEKPNGVAITLKGDISNFCHYNKTLKFEILENKYE